MADYTEPEFCNGNLVRSPGIDSESGGPVRQPFLSYRAAMLHRPAESNPRNRFLVTIRAQFCHRGWKPWAERYPFPPGKSSLLLNITISLLNERIEQSHNGDSREKARVNQVRLYIRRGGRGREWCMGVFSKLCTESSCSYMKSFHKFKNYWKGQTYLPSGWNLCRIGRQFLSVVGNRNVCGKWYGFGDSLLFHS